MGFFSQISDGFRSLFGTPRSHSVGEKFEFYVGRVIFRSGDFELIQKTHRFNERNSSFVPSAQPDFRFRDRRTGKQFFVEAKYRKQFFDGAVNWCTEKQLSRYHQNNKECTVFILLGVGGKPERPAFIALIPLKRVNFARLFRSFAESYSIDAGKPVSSKILWRR